jgi:hypothetical protein
MTWLTMVVIGLLFGSLMQRFVFRLPKLDALKLALRRQIAAHPEADGEAVEGALLSLEQRMRADRTVQITRWVAGAGMALGIGLALALYGNARLATDDSNKAGLVFAAISGITTFFVYRAQTRVMHRHFEEAFAERTRDRLGD